MQVFILAGAVVSAVGFLLLALTAKRVTWWDDQYVSRNRPLSLLGWLLVIIGLGVVVLFAWANGQLGPK